jgi:(p)ppGpp synthase/HD superfamily hydrolase
MHHESEYGVAAHIIYKDAEESNGQQESSSWFANLVPTLFRPFAWRNNPSQGDLDITKDIPPQQKIPNWINQIGDMYTHEKASGNEFIEDMRNDFFSNRIFVFTPNGDVVDLPAKAGPIDFAYAIHSEVGNHISGAKVNQKLVSLDTELRNGDIVEIETKASAKPSPKWIQMARTSIAKRRIKSALGELGKK